MKDMRKLMEAVQLNEYFVKGGEPYSSMQLLNIFSDFTPGQKISEFEEDFAASPEWMAVEEKYSKYADVLSKQLKKVAKKKLSDEDADAIESVMYSGSDSYEDPEVASQDLPEIYDQQIALVCELLEIAPPNLDESLEEAPVKKKKKTPSPINRAKQLEALDEIGNLSEQILELMYDAGLPSGTERKFMDFMESLEQFLQADSMRHAKDSWGDDESWDSEEE